MGLFEFLWSTNRRHHPQSSISADCAYSPLMDSNVNSIESEKTYFTGGFGSEINLNSVSSEISSSRNIPTRDYIVSKSDTLASIAAKFWTTPSTVKQMNKLPTQFVFPGQVLKVPNLESPKSLPSEPR